MNPNLGKYRYFYCIKFHKTCHHKTFFLNFWMFTNIIIIDVIRNIFLSWHVVWMITLYILLLLTIDDAWRDLWQHTRAEKWCRPIIYEILWFYGIPFETMKWIFIIYSQDLEIHLDLRFKQFNNEQISDKILKRILFEIH